MVNDLVLAVIGSSVIASSVTAIFTKINSDKSLKLKYITEERRKWRDAIRDSIVRLRKVYNSSYDIKNKKKIYSEIKTYILLRLNPNDKNDRQIIELLDEFIQTNNIEKLKKIEEAMAYLLKFDWERAKKESNTKSLTRYSILLWPILLIIFLTVEDIYKYKESFKVLLKNITDWKVITLSIVLILLSIIKYLVNRYWINDFCHENTNGKLCYLLNIPYRQRINEDDE